MNTRFYDTDVTDAAWAVPVTESGLEFLFGKRRRHQHRSVCRGRLLAGQEVPADVLRLT
jgi:hypothetical protein